MLIFLGGIVDIIIYKKVEDNILEELLFVSGGLWGGKFVDDVFMKFFCDFVGDKIMDMLKEKSMEDYVEICRMFEIKKRIILFDKNSLVIMIIL